MPLSGKQSIIGRPLLKMGDSESNYAELVDPVSGGPSIRHRAKIEAQIIQKDVISRNLTSSRSNRSTFTVNPAHAMGVTTLAITPSEQNLKLLSKRHFTLLQ